MANDLFSVRARGRDESLRLLVVGKRGAILYWYPRTPEWLIAQSIRHLALVSVTIGFAGITNAGQVSLQTIALTGDLAPGVSAAATFQTLTSPFISGNGEVFFRATASGESGVWKYSQGLLSNVAHTGEANRPYSNNAVIYNARPNASGDVLIGYETYGPSSASSGIYVLDSSGDRSIAFEGEPAPGISGDVYFGNLAATRFGPNGGVVFGAVLLGADTQIGNRGSLWVDRGNGPTLIARQGIPTTVLPAGNTFSSFEAGVIDAFNRVVFEAELSDGRETIWRDDGGVLANIATTGQNPPGIGESSITYDDFFRPSTNAAGNLAIWAKLSGTGLSTGNDEAFWSGAADDLQLVVREGTAVAGADGPLTFTNLEPPVRINGVGQILFYGTAQEDYGGTGLWLGQPGDFRLAVRLGDTPPGLVGDIRFSAAFDPVINALGHVAFEGFLMGEDLIRSPTGDRAVVDGHGIWFWADGRLHQIVRTGDELKVGEKDVRLISSIDYYGFLASSGNSDGLPSPFSDRDEIVFRLTFRDGSRGVFMATIVPERANWGLLVMASMLVRRRGPKPTAL